MLILYLCRHAKSSWDVPHMPDIERPLNARGQRDAPFMAQVFKERGEPLDLMITSTAARALGTAHAFSKALGAHGTTYFDAAEKRPQLVTDGRLYHSSLSTLIRLIHELPDQAQHVMLFGHNPGFTELADVLSGADLDNLPTCGMVRIDLPFSSWQMVAKDTGIAVWKDFPKHHVVTG